MTCKEKLKLDRPKLDDDDIRWHIRYDCPSSFGYLDDPDCNVVECVDCWNREIPSDENKLKDIIAQALSLNHELGEAELNEAIEALKREYGANTDNNKIGTIEFGISVKKCSECNRVNDIVRCEECIDWYDRDEVCMKIYSDGALSQYAYQHRKPTDFCSYGRRTKENTVDIPPKSPARFYAEDNE